MIPKDLHRIGSHSKQYIYSARVVISIHNDTDTGFCFIHNGRAMNPTNKRHCRMGGDILSIQDREVL